MPELPEVQMVVNSLEPVVTGARIVSAKLIRSDILTPAGCDFIAGISNQTIVRVFRRAKRIMFQLGDGNHFYIHLGMSGRIRIEAADTPLVKHTHLTIDVLSASKAPSQIRFIDPRRFGGVWWLGDKPEDPTLGPEPLDIRSDDLATQLSGTKRHIKSTLLDQSVVAGLGNIYVDEALHEAGIHPQTRTHKLKTPQIDELCTAVKKVLNRAIQHRGSTLRDYVDANGTPGDFQKVHRVYDRKDEPCMKCRTPIKRIVIGGRSTHFCPKCQARKR